VQVFPPDKHQISNQKRTCNCCYQPSRYDEFYSPIHLGFSFPFARLTYRLMVCS